jgi:hypothetical protein
MIPLEERIRMGIRGREKVLQKYTWEKAAEKLETIYQQVILENKKRSKTAER